MNETEIIEGAALGAVLDPQLQGKRYRVRLIEGDRLGSSGYYPAEMLKRDGPRIFKKGTPMYLDHQTPDEKMHKPFGSVSTFAGTLAEDAVYENDGLYADIEVFDHHVPMIKAIKDHIGISIRAKGRTANEKIDGKTVPVFRELIEARSADFVVKAGAGGKIVSILESATLEEETMDEVLEQLAELKKALPAMVKEAVEAAVPAQGKPAADAEEAKTVEVVDYDKVVELAEALAGSKLSATGRARVLTLHKADQTKDIAELITAEETYVSENSEAPAEAGAEEGADAEESAHRNGAEELTLPSRWITKK